MLSVVRDGRSRSFPDRLLEIVRETDSATWLRGIERNRSNNRELRVSAGEAGFDFSPTRLRCFIHLV
jgi:hypothetical protein